MLETAEGVFKTYLFFQFLWLAMYILAKLFYDSNFRKVAPTILSTPDTMELGIKMAKININLTLFSELQRISGFLTIGTVGYLVVGIISL